MENSRRERHGGEKKRSNKLLAPPNVYVENACTSFYGEHVSKHFRYDLKNFAVKQVRLLLKNLNPIDNVGTKTKVFDSPRHSSLRRKSRSAFAWSKPQVYATSPSGRTPLRGKFSAALLHASDLVWCIFALSGVSFVFSLEARGTRVPETTTVQTGLARTRGRLEGLLCFSLRTATLLKATPEA